MTPLSSLWLPILVSAVAVFVLSSIIHMMTPLHKNDFRKAPDENALTEAIRKLALPPGDYMVPKPSSMQDMKSPEFAERVKRGPNFMMTVFPGNWSGMGRQLTLWFLFSLVVIVIAAWVAGTAAGPGSDWHLVFHYAAITSFMGYAGALWPQWIWYGKNLGTTLRGTFDGLVYAVAIGVVMSWLWPH